jgi:hypothetical protein
MNRFLALIAPTAAAAAVAAAITIPAGADQTAGQTADPGAQLVSCLRANGVDIPADTRGVAIKQWVGAHQSDPNVDRALKSCNDNAPAPEELLSCLRAHGLDVPSTIEELKPWIAAHANDPSAKAAFEACHFQASPPDGKAGPACGPGKPAPPDAKLETTPQTTPETATTTARSIVFR